MSIKVAVEKCKGQKEEEKGDREEEDREEERMKLQAVW